MLQSMKAEFSAMSQIKLKVGFNAVELLPGIRPTVSVVNPCFTYLRSTKMS